MKSKKNNKKIRLVNNLTIFLVIDIVLFIISSKYYFFYNIFDPVIIPVKNYTSSISNNIGNYFYTINNLNNINRENIILKDEIYSYRSKIASLNNNINQNKSLDSQIKGNYLNNKYKYIYSEIMYYGTNNTFGYTYIDSGELQGVKINDPVVYNNYLVGVISKVFNNYSKVMLLSNLNINIPVLINKTNGILTGSLSTSLTIQDITQLDNINIGDIVLTSGLNGTFPKNLIIGYVSSISGGKSNVFKTVSVDSAVNINNLKYLFVLKYE